MKILLTRTLNKTPMLIPNIGLGYLATSLLREGHDVEILDCILERINSVRFLSYLKKHSYDLIGFQVYTFDVHFLRPYLEVARTVTPETYLIAGGPHPTAAPDEMLFSFPELDVVFCGEAEPGLPAFCSLLDGLLSKQRISFADLTEKHDFSDIPGLVYRKSKSEIKYNNSAIVEDIDVIGFPAWDLLKPDMYPPAPQGTFTRRLPVAPIIVTRGCPFDCTFCAAHLMAGKKLRTRSAQKVVDEIEFLMEHYGIREIHIEDDNFSLNKKIVKSYCLEILNRGIDITWSCPNGLRLDSLDQEIVELMEQSGCYSIAIGIESGSQRILDLMKKRLKVEEVAEKIAMIRRYSRISITGFFMIGYPDESISEIRDTIRFSLELDLDKVNFGVFMPLPGTTIFNEMKDRGLLKNLDYSRITEYRAPFSTGKLSSRKLRLLLQWSFLRFYLRPHIIIRFVREIKSWYQIKILGYRLLEVFWR